MKNLILAVLIVAATLAATDYEFVVQETHNFEGSGLRGLDCYDLEGQLMLTTESSTTFWSYSTFELVSVWGNGSIQGWGGCMLLNFPDYIYAVNMGASDDILLRESMPDWDYAFNPAFTKGRGMDCDESGYVWQTTYEEKLYKMSFDGSSFTTEMQYLLTDVQAAAGVTSMDLYGLGLVNHLMVVDNGEYGGFCLYEIVGSALVLVDKIPSPASMNPLGLRGLAFSLANQTFYVSYDFEEECCITEMDLVESNALEQSTWGAVKSAF